jgi:hypothetical protein
MLRGDVVSWFPGLHRLHQTLLKDSQSITERAHVIGRLGCEDGPTLKFPNSRANSLQLSAHIPAELQVLRRRKTLQSLALLDDLSS